MGVGVVGVRVCGCLDKRVGVHGECVEKRAMERGSGEGKEGGAGEGRRQLCAMGRRCREGKREEGDTSRPVSGYSCFLYSVASSPFRPGHSGSLHL